MKAVVYSAGGPEGMQIGSAAVPNVQAHEILIKVYATAINRADCIQVCLNILCIRIEVLYCL
jgi:NADPH:quinone reductase-like Zn-dependent oxidoreductase